MAAETTLLTLWQLIAMHFNFPGPTDGFDHIPSTTEIAAALHVGSTS